MAAFAVSHWLFAKGDTLKSFTTARAILGNVILSTIPTRHYPPKTNCNPLNVASCSFFFFLFFLFLSTRTALYAVLFCRTIWLIAFHLSRRRTIWLIALHLSRRMPVWNSFCLHYSEMPCPFPFLYVRTSTTSFNIVIF